MVSGTQGRPEQKHQPGASVVGLGHSLQHVPPRPGHRALSDHQVLRAQGTLPGHLWVASRTPAEGGTLHGPPYHPGGPYPLQPFLGGGGRELLTPHSGMSLQAPPPPSGM